MSVDKSLAQKYGKIFSIWTMYVFVFSYVCYSLKLFRMGNHCKAVGRLAVSMSLGIKLLEPTTPETANVIYGSPGR
jgi:hypothetical protein